ALKGDEDFVVHFYCGIKYSKTHETNFVSFYVVNVGRLGMFFDPVYLHQEKVPILIVLGMFVVITFTSPCTYALSSSAYALEMLILNVDEQIS
ncbi:hypothetical protein ACJX0J_018524, partial [Zea mays]